MCSQWLDKLSAVIFPPPLGWSLLLPTASSQLALPLQLWPPSHTSMRSITASRDSCHAGSKRKGKRSPSLWSLPVLSIRADKGEQGESTICLQNDGPGNQVETVGVS